MPSGLGFLWLLRLGVIHLMRKQSFLKTDISYPPDTHIDGPLSAQALFSIKVEAPPISFSLSFMVCFRVKS